MVTLIYDGDCGICTDSVKWLRRHLQPDADVELVPFQSIDDLGAFGVTLTDVNSSVWWVDRGGTRLGGAPAVTQALRRCGRPWPVVGRVLDVWPVRLGAARAYRWVAEHRHRLSRGVTACGTLDAATRK